MSDELREQRCGFRPALVFRVAGITHEGRQVAASRAGAHCTATESPPCELVPEPDNEYDPDAVAIQVGTARHPLTQQWFYQQIGYVPKRICIDCGELMGGRKLTHPACSSCEGGNLLLANSLIARALAGTGTLRVALDGIYRAPSERQHNFGARVAVRYEPGADEDFPGLEILTREEHGEAFR